jgi:HSP90 family molecular chaperone
MTDPALQPQAEVSEELVYAPAVLILSEDLYPRKLEIIREYVQNASDAWMHLKAWPRPSRMTGRR